MLARSETALITYQIETFDQIIDEAQGLFPGHWDEIASHKEDRRLKPDLLVRKKAEETGRLIIATAREQGRLIGYIDWFVYQDVNSSATRTCETDVYFVEDRPNRGLIMLAMIRMSLKHLAKMGVTYARPRTKFKAEGLGRGAGPIWRALGFRPNEVIYSKILIAE